MTTRLNRPRLPSGVPDTYSPEYVQQLVRALEFALDMLEVAGPLRGPTLNISAVPSNGSGLRVGDVYSDSGVLKIVRSNVAYAGSLTATGAVGSVTVTVV